MRYFYILIFISFISSQNIFALAKEPVTALDTARLLLGNKIMHSQTDYDYSYYPWVMYLYHHLNPEGLELDSSRYEKSLSPDKYKRYYLYSKLVGKNEFVSADCLDEKESGRWNELQKLFFVSVYDGPTWKFPADYVSRLQTASTEIEFDSPVLVLANIYFLKQYNWNKLSNKEKKEIDALANDLAKNLYNGYILNKEWGFRKLLALWAIRINKIGIANDIDETELTNYFDRKYWIIRFDNDYKDASLMKKEGGVFTTSMSNLCALWLFTLNR